MLLPAFDYPSAQTVPGNLLNKTLPEFHRRLTGYLLYSYTLILGEGLVADGIGQMARERNLRCLCAMYSVEFK